MLKNLLRTYIQLYTTPLLLLAQLFLEYRESLALHSSYVLPELMVVMISRVSSIILVCTLVFRNPDFMYQFRPMPTTSSKIFDLHFFSSSESCCFACAGKSALSNNSSGGSLRKIVVPCLSSL